MLTGTFVEDIIGALLKHPRFSNGKLAYAHAEWQAQSTLQIHRLAHENLGCGAWKRTDEAVPVTDMGDALAVLDVADPKRVRMVVPSEELGRFGAPLKSARVRVRADYERVPSSL